MSKAQPSIAILGIRGVPAAHGGFETFAERLAIYLIAQGWRVTVYCQTCDIDSAFVDTWRGVRRIHIPSVDSGVGSMRFDWDAIGDVLQRQDEIDITLTLGYNTAIFCSRLRLSGMVNLINMDGVEWARKKWSRLTRFWFWVNDWAGCCVANHLIADHPAIESLLRTRTKAEKITMIPYGADAILTETSAEPLEKFGLQAQKFITLIARPERENSVLEMVRAFSKRPRGITLAVLGRYVPDAAPYHAEVLAAASPEVLFLGAIHDDVVVHSLRSHSLFYLHGHQVGGTNPSLLEALGAGNPVLAHDNQFNRWVAGEAAVYFKSDDECASCFDRLLADQALRERLSHAARERHAQAFQWQTALSTYDALLREHLPLAQRMDARLSSLAG